LPLTGRFIKDALLSDWNNCKNWAAAIAERHRTDSPTSIQKWVVHMNHRRRVGTAGKPLMSPFTSETQSPDSSHDRLLSRPSDAPPAQVTLFPSNMLIALDFSRVPSSSGQPIRHITETDGKGGISALLLCILRASSPSFFRWFEGEGGDPEGEGTTRVGEVVRNTVSGDDTRGHSPEVRIPRSRRTTPLSG
jgi:hypothetical protein